MYLTRMYLNIRRRSAMVLLNSPQRMHAAVESAFPPESSDPSSGRALWRIDRQSTATSLILASPTEPDLTHLVEQAGWQTGEMWQTRPYAPLLDALTKGQTWRFRLTANPTYSGCKDGWSDTKPRGHVTVKQQEGWLISRCSRLGIAIPDGPSGEAELAVFDRRLLRFHRGSSAPVTIATATYEGVLDVVDPALLRNALIVGIGRAKAYGCGLLTLAPQGT